MKDAMDKVKKFHELGSVPVSNMPSRASYVDNSKIRIKLLQEEFLEYKEAEADEDLVAIAKELADMVYVICGTALTYGIPFDEVFDEVHRSNLSKFINGVKMRADGKILKGDSYFLPELHKIFNKLYPGCLDEYYTEDFIR